MILLRRDNFKYKINFCLGLILLTPIITFASNSNKTEDVKKLIDVKKLVSKSTLECSFNTSSENLIDFYNSLQRASFKKINHKNFAIDESFIVNGVKLISNTSKKYKSEQSVNMDTNFKKFGVEVLRVSSFVQGGEYENFGYYIILKDRPSINESILQKHGIDMKYSVVEKTNGGNTRVRCILVG